MKKISIILCSMILTFSSYGKGDKINYLKVLKSNHFLYELNIGTGEGIFLNKETEKMKIEVYAFPKPGAKKVFEVPVISKEVKYPGQIYTHFQDGRSFFRQEGIYTKERNGDFFKVRYKGKVGWVNKKQFPRITNVEEFISRSLINFEVSKKNPLYLNLKAGGIEKKKVNIKYYDDSESISVDILKYKWVRNKLWIKVKVWREACTDNFYSKEPIEGWIHPFEEDGFPKFSYGSC